MNKKKISMLLTIVLITAIFSIRPLISKENSPAATMGSIGCNQKVYEKQDTGTGSVENDGPLSYSYPMGEVSLNSKKCFLL